MATLNASDIADLTKATLRDLGPLRFQNIAQKLVHYEVFSKWFKKDKVSFDSGYGIQRTLMHTLSGAAKHSGHLEKDEVNIPDVLTQLTVDWVHAETSWAIVYQTDVLMNSGKSLILNVLKPRRADALLSLVEELETRAWASPADSTAAKKYPYGMPYWVVQNATTGFNGGAATGHTTVGGVNLTTAPNFKNYTITYAARTSGDLVKNLRKAHRNCRFVSPITIEDYRGGIGERYRIYTTETVFADLEDIATGQNENLGRDIAEMDGTVVFRKHPVIWVPELDATTNGPVYMIDHSTFFPVCLKGDYLRESDARQAPEQHNVWMIHVDLTYNFCCVDRRRNAVLYDSTL